MVTALVTMLLVPASPSFERDYIVCFELLDRQNETSEDVTSDKTDFLKHSDVFRPQINQ